MYPPPLSHLVCLVLSYIYRSKAVPVLANDYEIQSGYKSKARHKRGFHYGYSVGALLIKRVCRVKKTPFWGHIHT